MSLLSHIRGFFTNTSTNNRKSKQLQPADYSDQIDPKKISKRKNFFETPWISLLVLPLTTTLVGVLAALYLNDWRAAENQKQRTIGLLKVAIQECEAIMESISSLQIQTEPVFVPTIGISLLNLQTDSEALSSMAVDEFSEFVTQVVNIQSNLNDYNRLANDFRFFTIRTPTNAPPPMLPITKTPDKPETPEEFQNRLKQASLEISEMRQEHLDRLSSTLRSYQNAVESFCKVGNRIYDRARG